MSKLVENYGMAEFKRSEVKFNVSHYTKLGIFTQICMHVYCRIVNIGLGKYLELNR